MIGKGIICFQNWNHTRKAHGRAIYVYHWATKWKVWVRIKCFIWLLSSVYVSDVHFSSEHPVITKVYSRFIKFTISNDFLIPILYNFERCLMYDRTWKRIVDESLPPNARKKRPRSKWHTEILWNIHKSNATKTLWHTASTVISSEFFM